MNTLGSRVAYVNSQLLISPNIRGCNGTTTYLISKALVAETTSDIAHSSKQYTYTNAFTFRLKPCVKRGHADVLKST